MKVLKIRIDHQPAVLLKSFLSLDEITINQSNKFLYFKIDSFNPEIGLPNGSLLSQVEYFKVELNTGTYKNNTETKRNDDLANMINDAIRVSDPYYLSFPIDHKFAYMDESNKLIIRSLKLGIYASVKIFPDYIDSIFQTIIFKESYVKGIVKNIFNNYLSGELIELSVVAETSDEGDVNITNDSNLTIFSLDPNNFYMIPNSYDSALKTIDVMPLKEGSGIIKVVYVNNGEKFINSIQLLSHGSFFKDNYLDYLLPQLDSENIRNNQFVKSIFDSLMEMIDILYAYNEDLRIISNFREGKSKFISMLAQNVGFERIDFTDIGTRYEWSNNETFRELIANMFDLISVRGTKLTYELFFNALGYTTTFQEFWYDSDGNLIEINPYDESKSTFYAYSTTGALIDNPPYPRPDPRKNNNLLSNDYNNFGDYLRILNSNGSVSYIPKDNVILPTKNNNFDIDVFKNNKSNYVKITINNSINDNVFQDPQNFSIEKKIIIKRYLEFLRPSHIQYILESFENDFEPETFDILSLMEEEISISELQEFKDYLIDSIEGILNYSDYDFNIGDVKNILEELSSFNKWDTLLKFDKEGNVYDYRNLFVENFTVESI